ncbi:hypothetical protein BDV28DRAFT_165091 [Aspergillus coremiiformis]|uniref:Peptidase A2 domain-containing protein n=1 Tax=Aspergillus coremiiformis TaxID=138285 RepID=A0A5N6YRH4_9EURO|nr:hypothetical protein BDV28DRAFT_165091 [Aspergillus coremiiformis]
MDMPEKYQPSLVLENVADHLRYYHDDLRVSLPTNHFTYEQALSVTIECVHGLPDRVILPTNNLARRAALRAIALENVEDEKKSTPSSSSHVIRTAGKLSTKDCPRPVSGERRALLKKRFEDTNDHPLGRPFILELHAPRTEDTLIGVVANVVISAVDWEPGMPECELKGIEMLWDTGAACTIITKDILDERFQAHLSGPTHKPYENRDGTRVQISFVLEFSNSLFAMDLIALVVDKDTVPNIRSGIILGQKACIDSLQYRSIPRSVLKAKGEAIDEKLWGDIILESYVDLDGTFKEID